MIWIIIGIIIVAAIAGFMVLGVYLEKKKKANAQGNLEKARALFKEGNHNASLMALSKAFFVPTDGVYEAKDALTAFEVIVLFDELATAMNIDLSSYYKDLKPSLEKASKEGGLVRERLTKPMEELFDKMDSDEGIVEVLYGNVQSGNGIVTDDEEHLHIERNYPDGANQIINKVGKLLVTQKLDEAMSTLEGHMGTDNRDFKLYLISTRGGVYFMKKNYQAAITDYKECINLDAEDPGNWRNLAEAYQYAGNKQEALETAKHALNMKLLDKHDRKAVLDVIKSVSK